jgi:glycosyltransferase involved in cell wall biosynthesis
MAGITSVVIAFNEERNIVDCLESLRWTDEIILVDSMSTDQTVSRASLYTDKIFQRPWPGYVEQKNFGLMQASYDWILFVDADERISKELAREITDLINEKDSDCVGYNILRRSYYFSRLIKHGEWYPDMQLRLIKKGKGVWCGGRVHEYILLKGKAGHLANPMYHYTYRDINHHLEKFNLYSSLFALDAFDRKEDVKLRYLLGWPMIRFIEGYFLKKGFKDGMPGFIIAVMQSFEVFLRYAKLWEMYRSDNKSKKGK